MTELMSKFASLLSQKEMRDNKRYSQKEIAEAIDVSEAVISRWMNGKQLESTTLRTVLKMCKWLECDIGDLVMRKDFDGEEES